MYSVTPDSADILTEIGILYLKVNDPDSAYDKLSAANKIDEKSTKALIALGAVLQSKNDIDGALNRYNRIPSTFNDYPEIWSNLGLCFLKKQKLIAVSIIIIYIIFEYSFFLVIGTKVMSLNGT